MKMNYCTALAIAFSCLASTGITQAATVSYDELNRPISFEGVSYYTGTTYSDPYNVTVVWDKSFDEVYGTGYKIDGEPYNTPEFLGSASTYWQAFALGTALIDDGYPGQQDTAILDRVIVPQLLWDSDTGPSEDWVVQGSTFYIDLATWLNQVNPEAYSTSIAYEGLGYTIWTPVNPVPVPPALILMLSGIICLGFASRKKNAA